MTLIKAVRRLHFCAGHSVTGHESKCAHLHGHNYIVFVEAEAPELDRQGRIVDFSVLKQKIGTWIDEHWDHKFLLWDNDPRIKTLMQVEPALVLLHRIPTAENLAAILLENVCPMLLRDSSVRVTKVTVWETENCYAEASF